MMFEQVFDTVKESPMTALLIDEYVAPAPARVWRARSAPASHAPAAHAPAALAPVPRRPPAASQPRTQRPAPSPAALVPARPTHAKAPVALAGPVVSSSLPERLYWTERGLAVALGVVALVVGLMVATLVTGFLAVSNEPVGAPVPAAAAALMVDPGILAGPGR